MKQLSPIRIDILFFEGCPNHVLALCQVQDVVRELGVEAIIREVEVKASDDFAQLRFFGSPTLQVEGRDIDPAVVGRSDYSFSCRMYERSGKPPREMMVRAILAGGER